MPRVLRHHQRGGHALVGHVGLDDAQVAVGQVDEVVEVAADRLGRLPVGRHLPARQLGQFLRQQGLLDDAGDAQLLLQPLTGLRLDLLLADELRHAHGRRGLGRQVTEELAVVGRVLLFAPPRPQVEQADQLALADQRRDQLDPGLAQRTQGGRIQLQPLQVHRTPGAQQVRAQRVVRREIQRQDLGCHCCRAGRRLSGHWLGRLFLRLFAKWVAHNRSVSL